MASKKAQQKLTRIFLFLFLINFLRAPSSATSPPDIKKNFPLPLKKLWKILCIWVRESWAKKKNLLKKIWAKCCLNVLQNFSMRKIHPKWEKTSKATWSCAKSGMFCFRKKSSSFFLKISLIFFLEKILPVFQYWFWHYETLLWIILENFSLWKIFAKKKNGKNIWGEKFIISNQSFLFSKFSIQCQPLFPPFGCARFWTKKSQDKSVTFFIFCFPFC